MLVYLPVFCSKLWWLCRLYCVTAKAMCDTQKTYSGEFVCQQCCVSAEAKGPIHFDTDLCLITEDIGGTGFSLIYFSWVIKPCVSDLFCSTILWHCDLMLVDIASLFWLDLRSHLFETQLDLEASLSVLFITYSHLLFSHVTLQFETIFLVCNSIFPSDLLCIIYGIKHSIALI